MLLYHNVESDTEATNSMPFSSDVLKNNSDLKSDIGICVNVKQYVNHFTSSNEVKKQKKSVSVVELIPRQTPPRWPHLGRELAYDRLK